MVNTVRKLHPATLWFILILATQANALEPAGLMRGFARSNMLLTTAKHCTQFEVFVARTHDQRAQGLMYVQQMEELEGMAFLYPGADTISMWMKNTFIPLDMLFVDDLGRIVHLHKNAVPHSTAIISSVETVSLVVELNAGSIDKFGIAVGDTVTLPAG